MRRLITLLLLVMVLPTAAVSQRRRTPTPPRPVEVAKNSPQTLGQAVEKYVSSYTIKSDGTAVQTLEMLQKCAIEACVERMKKLEQIYNAELQSLKLISATLIKKDGTKVDVTKDNGKSLPTPQAESAPGFSSLRQFAVVFDKYELGDAISHKVEVHTTKSIFGNHFDSLELYPAVFEWKSIEVNVTAPTDVHLYFDTTGLEGGETVSGNGTKTWKWKRTGLSAFPIETAMYDTQRMSPRFAVTTFQSFEQLAAAFGDGVRRQAVVTPEVQTLADEVTKGLKDQSDQAAAIYQWVNKNIRYLLVVLDRGGWVPHSTEQILKNRYGDCKDYTALIYAMLKAKGIDSVPVLINAQFSNWFPNVATMKHFDHAILYVPELKLFADATSPNTRLGMIPQQLVGKTALLSGERPALIAVPKDRPDDNQLLSDVEVEFFENGSLRSSVNNTFAGRSEILFRPLFTDAKRSGMADSLVKLQLAYYGLTGTGQVLEISDPHSVSDPFKMKLQVDLPEFTTFAKKGSLSLPAGINAMSMATMELFTKEERRNTDLFIGATRMRERFKVKLPEKVTVSELPTTIKFANKTGTFEFSVLRTPDGFELLRELVLLTDAIEPGDYADFQVLVEKAVRAVNAEVGYTSDGSLSAKRPRSGKSSPKPTANGMDGVKDVVSEMLGVEDAKLPSTEVRRLEARLKAKPAEVETREKLLRHYRSSGVKETAAVIAARKEHKLWFIRNLPRRATTRLIGWYFSREDSLEYTALRDEWKKQIATKPTDLGIWLNAFDLVQYAESELAEEFLLGGKSLFPNAYEFPRELSLLNASRLEDSDANLEKRAVWTRQCLEFGKHALQILKTERSNVRDSDRAELLLGLAPVAFDSGDLDLAEALSRELVLDFGGDTSGSKFEEAAHNGNTILGRSALAKGDVQKAVDHLLISIRAPLRKPEGYFYQINLSLAEELFKKGEKKAVSEFLSLALKISGYVDSPDLNEDEITAIKKWIAEIEKDGSPTFDFDMP